MKTFQFFWAIIFFLSFSSIFKIEVDGIDCARSVTEYLLPVITEQTHEILYVEKQNKILITQFSNSKLLKATLGSRGGFRDVVSYKIKNESHGLHGLAASKAYKDKFWLSLEIGNQLILVDPVISQTKGNLKYLKTIDVPKPGKGPHHIAEYGTNLWATLKASNQVLRINFKKTTDYQLYKAQPTPVFLAQHPISKDIYVSEYKTNSILRINVKQNTTSRIQVPKSAGESPVGIVSDGGKYVWIALLSIQSKGTGGFGKIYSNGTTKWFQLKTTIGKKAALLHIAFDIDVSSEPQPGMWFLGSSVEDPNALDMIVRTNFHDKDMEIFDRETIAVLPSQSIKAHRISTSKLGLYASELTSSRVAFYGRKKSSKCDFTFQMVNVSESDEI